MVRVSLERLFPMTAIDWTFSLPLRGSDPIQQPAVHMTFGIVMVVSISIPPFFEVYVIFWSGRKSFRVITTVLLSVPNISIFLLIAFFVQVKAGCKLGDQSFPSVQSKAVNHFSTKTFFSEMITAYLGTSHYLSWRGAWRRKRGALEGQKEGFFFGGGGSLIQVKNFRLPYFGIMFERGHESFGRGGLEIFFASKTFSPPRPPPSSDLNYDWSLINITKIYELHASSNMIEEGTIFMIRI